MSLINDPMVICFMIAFAAAVGIPVALMYSIFNRIYKSLEEDMKTFVKRRESFKRSRDELN